MTFTKRQTSTMKLPNQSIYQWYAPVYDRLFGPLLAVRRRQSVELLQMKPGEKLLISGVGTGLDLPLISAGVEVTGIDISTEMLQQAMQKHSPARVLLMPMDAQHLDFSDIQFNLTRPC